MTEADWLGGIHPEPMWEFIKGTISSRKGRLFACACCRHIWELLVDSTSRTAVETAEAYADGKVSTEELHAANVAAVKARRNYQGAASIRSLAAIMTAARKVPIMGVVQFALSKQGIHAIPDYPAQATLLRDMFANPFDPVTIDHSWRTSTTTKLAAMIYNDRAFAHLPILADALEEAGCDDDATLNHCRQPGEHARGCWVVDLLLGKE